MDFGGGQLTLLSLTHQRGGIQSGIALGWGGVAQLAAEIAILFMTGAVKTCYLVINDPKCLFLTNNAVF